MDGVFQVAYLVGLTVGAFIRGWYGIKYRQNRAAIYRQEGFVVGLLASLWGVAILVPLAHMLTPALDFADYKLPLAAGWAGVAVFAVCLWLLWRSHVALGANFSSTVEVKQRHVLVTHGVYQHMRHPMYAAHLLWGIAQALLVHNWIAGPVSLAVFVPLYFLRVPREERMMLQQFGSEYRSYMNRTGQVFPRFW